MGTLCVVVTTQGNWSTLRSMIVNSKHLVHVPVKTRTGEVLGKLSSLELDADTGKLVSLLVKVSGVKHLLDSELMIPWSKIISISEHEIIVADSFVPIGSAVLASKTVSTPPTA